MSWEDDLSKVAIPTNKAAPWEVSLARANLTPAPNPAGSYDSTLQFGPLDTHIPIGDGVQNFLAGMGKSMTDIGQGVARNVGLSNSSDVREKRAIDAPLMNTGAGVAGNIAGAMATLAPTMFIPGANTLLGSAAVGSLYGAAQPFESRNEQAKNIGINAVGAVGGNIAGKGLAGAYGLAKSASAPFFASGRAGMISQALKDFVPDPQRAIAALNAGGKELVPGSLPTAAEAAAADANNGIAGIAQLSKQVQQTAPQQFIDRTAANNAARIGAVRTVAGDVGERSFLDANRSAVADQMYSAARNAGIDPALLTPEALQNIATFQARVPQNVIDEAKSIAQLKGQPMTDQNSLDGMHWVKKGLDSLISKESGPNGSSTLLDAYTGLKNDMVSGMGKLSPLYDDARTTFIANSKPINEMDVGQALADKLIPALRDFGGNGNLNANAYAQALRNGDVVAQKVTGMPRATINDVLPDSKVSTLQAIGQDLARSSNATNLTKAAGSDTSQNMISQNILRQTTQGLGIPQSWAAALAKNKLAQTVMRPAEYVGNLGNDALMEDFSHTLIDPQRTAAALLRITNPNGGYFQQSGNQFIPRIGSAAGIALNPFSRGLSPASPAGSQ